MKKLPEIDNLWKKSEVIEHLSDNAKIYYLKSKIGTWHQDFCVFLAKRKINDTTSCILGCSIEHKDVIEKKNYRRGRIDFIGSVIKALDANSSQYTLCYQVNLKDQFFIRWLMDTDFILTASANRVKRLRKKLENISVN